MGGPRSKASLEEILAGFHTEEPFKAFASRIGMSPNTLRSKWVGAFGQEAFTERGKRLQAKAAAEVGRSTAATRIYKEASVVCSSCRDVVVLTTQHTAQMDDVSTYVCESCRCDRTCPVCDLPVDGIRGLSGHFRHRKEAGDEAHLAWRGGHTENRWEGKRLTDDYVICLFPECRHKAATLARHLKAAHDITAETYKAQFPDALIRSHRVTAAMSEAARNRQKDRGGVKTVTCPGCEQAREVSKFFVPGTHDLRCPSCRQVGRQKAEAARWEGLAEPEDFVTCLDCGHRAENLTSHMSTHPGYKTRHPEAMVVALRSAVRDKTAITGVSRSPEFGQRIREEKLLNLMFKDFEPFLEPDGSVDYRAMVGVTGWSPLTLRTYMKPLGLAFTKKYMEQAIRERTVTLTVEVLEKFKLGNGKVSIAASVAELGYCNITIKRECTRLGLEWAHGNVSQRRCLDAVSLALGGRPYKQEWMSWRFTNPKSGWRFKFDGYFEEIGLVVEFHGNHHWRFPNHYMPHESYRSEWEGMVERDRMKREMINAAPDLTYFEVREDEPYTDVSYLRGRLVEMGVVGR